MGEILKGMSLTELSIPEFVSWAGSILKAEIAKGPWKPSGAALHNTGRMAWPGKDAHGNLLTAKQRCENMSVTWTARWGQAGGPHFLITPVPSVILLWPAWIPGVHSPSFNRKFWGIEMVGDFQLDVFPQAMVGAASSVLQALYDVINTDANELNFHLHLEDPLTTHKHCPGANCGDKQTWLRRIASHVHEIAPGVVATNLKDLPHRHPVPDAFWGFMEGEEAFRSVAYPDGFASDGTPRYAIGFGTNLHPDGTPVKLGDVCTREQAEAWVKEHVDYINDVIYQEVHQPMTEGEHIAFLDFCYNEGTSAFAHSTLLADFNAGTYDLAASQFMQWNKKRNAVTKQLEVSKGLTDRRSKEEAIFKGADPKTLTRPQLVSSKPTQPAIALDPSIPGQVIQLKPIEAHAPVPLHLTVTGIQQPSTVVLNQRTYKPSWFTRLGMYLENFIIKHGA